MAFTVSYLSLKMDAQTFLDPTYRFCPDSLWDPKGDFCLGPILQVLRNQEIFGNVEMSSADV